MKIWKVLVEDFFQRWISPDDVVVDLGCGFGDFLNQVRCARRVGVDLNPAGRKYLAEGVEFHQGDVRELSFLADGTADLVFTSNLMEHLPDKRAVERMLTEVRRVLKPGGCFAALGPNLRFLPGTYWDFWDHVVPLTDRSVVELLECLDFRVRDCLPKFLPYTAGSSLPRGPFWVRMYLRFPLVWRLLGAQFLIRAGKPEAELPAGINKVPAAAAGRDS